MVDLFYRRVLSITVVFTLSTFAVPAVLQMERSAASDLDPAFGNNGRVLTDVFGVDFGNDMVAQPDGKIVVAGSANAAASSADFVVVRYLENGSLDPTFGNGGKVITDFGGGDAAFAVAITPDGKIIAAGSSSLNFAVAKYNADGSLDTTFGTNGRVSTDFTGFSDSAGAVIVQPDGKIVVAGIAGLVGSNGNFGIVRYNTDGSLDGSFGSAGRVSVDINGLRDQAFALLRQADGKLIVGGSAGNDFGIVRCNADGSLDSAFGTGGKLTTDFNGNTDQLNALVLQTDGKILAAGTTAVTSANTSFNFAIARYTTEGTSDAVFGNGGRTNIDFAGAADIASGIVVQSSGKIVVAGQARNGAADDFGLVRLNSDGSADASFGLNGKITTDFGQGDSALSLILQSNGQLIAGGYSVNSNFSVADLALARYFGDPVASTASVSGRVTTPSGLGLRNAVVNLVDSAGSRRTSTTSSFGLYSFANVPTGSGYSVSISSKRYRFTPQLLNIGGNLANVDFIGLE